MDFGMVSDDIRENLIDSVTRSWQEFVGHEWELDSTGFYFNSEDKEVINTHNDTKINKIQSSVIPQTLIGNLNYAKVIVFNLNMGAKKGDFEQMDVYNPRELQNSTPHAQAFWNMWSEDFKDNEYVEDMDPEKIANIILEAKSFKDDQVVEIYKNIVKFLTDTDKKNVTIQNKDNQIMHSKVEHYYWYVLLPLIQLKFPFEKNFISPGLLIDDYYSGIAGYGKSAFKIKYKQNDDKLGDRKKIGDVNYWNWQQMYKDMLTRISKPLSEKEDKVIIFEDDAFLKGKIEYFEEIMLVQMFPYASIDGKALTHDLHDVTNRYNEFVKEFLKAIDTHNQNHTDDPIIIVFNRVGNSQKILSEFLNEVGDKTSVYRNEIRRPKYLKDTLTEQ